MRATVVGGVVGGVGTGAGAIVVAGAAGVEGTAGAAGCEGCEAWADAAVAGGDHPDPPDAAVTGTADGVDPTGAVDALGVGVVTVVPSAATTGCTVAAGSGTAAAFGAGGASLSANAVKIEQVAATLRPAVSTREAGAALPRDRERRGGRASDRGASGASELMGQSPCSETVTTSMRWGCSTVIESSWTLSSSDSSSSS